MLRARRIVAVTRPLLMDIVEFDWVRIVRAVPAARLHLQRSRRAVTPEVGDLAWVSFAYRVEAPYEPMFIVECIAADGTLLWLADLRASEIEPVAWSARAARLDRRWMQ